MNKYLKVTELKPHNYYWSDLLGQMVFVTRGANRDSFVGSFKVPSGEIRSRGISNGELREIQASDLGESSCLTNDLRDVTKKEESLSKELADALAIALTNNLTITIAPDQHTGIDRLCLTVATNAGVQYTHTFKWSDFITHPSLLPILIYKGHKRVESHEAKKGAS